VTVDFQVWRGLSIHGHVVDPKGRGIPDVVIVAANRSGHEVTTKSESEGEFTASPLEPGEYFLRAGDSPGIWDDNPSWTQFTPLCVESGEQNVEVVVHLGVELRCKVLDAAHEPIGQAACTLVHVTSPHSNAGMMYSTASRGLMTYSNLAPGTYDVVATTSDGSFGSTRVSIAEATPSEATVVMERGAKLVATSRKDAAYLDFFVVSGDALIGYGGIGKGSSETVIVPAGRLTIEYFPWSTDPTAGSTKSVTLAAGETKSVELDLGN
jgi:hypothetical protein